MIIAKQDQAAIAGYLRERLAGPVGIEVWTRKESGLILTDRDPCTHCEDVVAVARELVSLHQGLSVTLYDLDRHASRAQEEGIDRPPTTVLRARGRELRFIGYYSGLLFPAMIDGVLLAGAGATPLSDETRRTLEALPEPVELELYLAPYDPLSAQMLRLGYALGVESRNVRVTAWEMSEFPILAGQRAVTEVPLAVVNGRRYAGAWVETDLVEQIRRLLSADDSPVIRERVVSTPFVNAEEARRLAEQAAKQPPPPGAQQPQQPPPGGLFIPGRD